MNGPIRVDWELGSGFVELVRSEVTRISARRWKDADPHEALSEVWIGIKRARPPIEDGQILIGKQIGRLQLIIQRRISNYFRSKCGRRPRQPNSSDFHHPDIEDLESTSEPPDRTVADRDLIEQVDRRLSEMPPHRAEAVLSRFGFPDTSRRPGGVLNAGTTRQNRDKHAKKGLEELRLALALSS
jgi:hypothetical protein